MEERYWRMVLCGLSIDDCWDWNGTKSGWGYGNLNAGQRKYAHAHRISWEIHNGPIPDGMWVLHHCDNPPCSNPRHLYLGSHSDNVDDRQARARTNAKLDHEKVRQIVTLVLCRIPRAEVADLFGVSDSTIDAVACGQNWSHVTTPAQIQAMRAMPRSDKVVVND